MDVIFDKLVKLHYIRTIINNKRYLCVNNTKLFHRLMFAKGSNSCL